MADRYRDNRPYADNTWRDREEGYGDYYGDRDRAYGARNGYRRDRDDYDDRRDYRDRDRNEPWNGYGRGPQDARGYGGAGTRRRVGRDDYDDRSQYQGDRYIPGNAGYANAQSDRDDDRYSGGYGRGSYGGPASYDNNGRGFRSFTMEDQGGSDFVAGGRRPYGGYGRGLGSYSAGYASGGGYGPEPRRGYTDRYEDRGFVDRAEDEVSSWFGDDDAERRRRMDHTGRGPANYTRSDDRITEDASDHLTNDWRVDARNVDVKVDNGEITLDGTVNSREQKHRAEMCVENIGGVRHVQNNLRVNDYDDFESDNDIDQNRVTTKKTTGALA